MYIVCILYDFCTYGYLGTYGMYIYIYIKIISTISTGVTMDI